MITEKEESRFCNGTKLIDSNRLNFAIKIDVMWTRVIMNKEKNGRSLNDHKLVVTR